MSPSWHDRAVFFVGPSAVQAVAWRGGLRKRAVASAVVRCAAASPPVAAALSAVNEALGRLELTRKTRARVVFSHHFVRMALVPGGRALRDEAEREAAARHLLQHRLGGDTAGWRVVLDGCGGAGAAVAAAAPAELIDGLAAMTADGALKVSKMEPLLSLAAQRCRQALRRGSAWLAVAEPGQLVLAAVVDGQWQTVRTHRLGGSLADELPKLLDRTELTDGPANVGSLVLATLGLASLGRDALGRWQVAQVPLDPQSVDTRLA